MSPALRMSLFFFVMFGTVGVHLPYWPVWLSGRGLGPTELGLVMASGFIVRGLTAPLVGSLSDRARDRRTVLVGASAVALFAGLLFHFADTLWMILLATAVMTVGFGAIGPMAENQAMLLATARRLDYGPVRAVGAMGFVATSVLGGWFLAGRSPETVLAMVVAMIALLILASAVLPEAPTAPHAERRGEVGPLVRQPTIRWLLAAVALIQCSHAFFYSFGTLEMRRMGVGDAAIGLLWSVGVLAEIVLFWRGQSVLKRFDPVTLLAVAGAGGVVRWVAMALLETPALLAFVQLLHAITFACCHLAMMIILARAVPVSHSATAQGLFAAGSAAFGMGSAMAFAGWLYGSFGVYGYFGMAAMAALGIGAGLMVGRSWHGGMLDLSR
ncbi:MAG: MFS transporter [Rhodospirillales bacterium]|nr:MFS transporter [Rhodospirillales bacterium]